ncbi:MAG: type II secretion system protein [Burkholderiales bacterium]|nr:type II secretion system protein [Burkholderiales bacterium]
MKRPCRRFADNVRSGTQRGFTLTEAVVVIAVTGVIAAMVAAFIRTPVQGYFDTMQRAQLSDLADTALRRLAVDLRRALPNSVRVTSLGGNVYLEFLLTKGTGRYRAAPDSDGGGEVLEFGHAATPYRFEVLGFMPTRPIVAGDAIVVHNLGPGSGASNAYLGSVGNLRRVSAVSGNNITLSPAVAFPRPSPDAHFHVVEDTVTYACIPDAVHPAAGEVRRYWGYAPTAVQPVSFPSVPNALLAQDVSACSFAYEPDAPATRGGVVSIGLTLTYTGGDSVRLVQQIHVGNAP